MIRVLAIAGLSIFSLEAAVSHPVINVRRTGPSVTLEISPDLKSWYTVTNIQTEQPAEYFRATSSYTLPYSFLNEYEDLRDVTWEESLYFTDKIEPINDPWLHHDSSGVRLLKARDGKLYDHPVLQGQYALSLVNSYLATRNQLYLDRAELHAQRLLETKIESRGGWFFPYNFDFQIDPTPAPGDFIYAPWYSAMAQGTVISVFTALHEITGKEIYKEAAAAAFEAFRLPVNTEEPWVADVDENGYLWLEEYAKDPENHQWVLNGHIFALWGVYDYWRLTRDPDALKIVQGAVTTVKESFEFFRTPGYVVKYSRKHPTLSKAYHPVIVKQFKCLYSITGDRRLARHVDELVADFPDPAISGTGVLSGGVTGFMFDQYGVVTNSLGVLCEAPVMVSISSRETLPHQPGTWLQIGSGELKGFWVRENSQTTVMKGVVQPIKFSPPRKLALNPGMPAYLGYKYSEDGSVTSSYYKYYATQGLMEFDMRASINSVPHVRISSGDLEGYWLPLTYRAALD